MSNRTLDRMLEREWHAAECACCECGFHRNGAHHPKIRCPRTGRCGECGNDWPCEEHAPSPRPHSITFFPNGQTAVGDIDGKQIGKYQGRHAAAIAALRRDGYDWTKLPDVMGAPW